MCFTFLSDVNYVPNDPNELNLVQSRWFTRGWTLQELIAPRSLRFYDRNWIFFGSRRNFFPQIQAATGIPREVFVESLLPEGISKNRSVAQRISWASKRTTTREEDIAYCLLGILGINMPLLYGEGEKAFQRLQEEVVKRSDDDSIFAWHDANGSLHTHRGLFARSPKEFEGCGDVIFPDGSPVEPFAMTNKGLQAVIGLREFCGVPTEFDALLHCTEATVGNDSQTWYPGTNPVANTVVRLRRLASDRLAYARVDSHRRLTDHPKSALPITPSTIYVRENIILPRSYRSSRTRGFCIMDYPQTWYHNAKLLPHDHCFECRHSGDRLWLRFRDRPMANTPNLGFTHLRNFRIDLVLRSAYAVGVSSILRLELLSESAQNRLRANQQNELEAQASFRKSVEHSSELDSMISSPTTHSTWNMHTLLHATLLDDQLWYSISLRDLGLWNSFR